MNKSKIISYLIIIIASIIIMIDFFNINIIQADDGAIHVLRIIGTYISFGEGNIPGLINSHFINELGYSTNLFYNPITTFVPVLIKLVTPSFEMSLNIFTLITVILSRNFYA